MAGEPTIQRGAYNKTPQRAERQQAPGFDPNAFMQMLAMMQQGTQQNIEAARKPVGQISQAAGNRPRYDIMADQNYRPANVGQYGQIGQDVYAGPNPEYQKQQQAMQPKPPGIMETIGNALSGLFGGGQGGQPQQGQAPQQPQMQGPPRSAMNPVQQQDPFQGGIAGPSPQQQSQMQGAMGNPQGQQPDILNTVDGFNSPIEQDQSGMSLRGLINVPSLALAPQVGVNALTQNLPGIASNAAQNFQKAQQVTDSAIGLAQGIRGASGVVSGGTALNSALQAEQAASGVANTALKAAHGGNAMMTAAGGAGKLGSGLRMAGKVAAPIQAGMMLAEGGRLVFDPEFRAKQEANFNSLEDKGAMAGLGQGLSQPISTIYNAGGGFADLFGQAQSAQASKMNEATLRKRPGVKKGLARVEQNKKDYKNKLSKKN